MIRTGFPAGSDGKESSCNVGDLGLTHGLGRSLGGGQEGMVTHSSVLFLGNPIAQRSLAGYSSLYGCKELDRTELLSTAQCMIRTQITQFTKGHKSKEALD